MADWDSADIKSRAINLVQEPTLGDVTSAATWYQLLSDSQRKVLLIWSVHLPHLQYTAPTQLTSSDGGYTYTLPSSVPALGDLEIRDGRSGPLLAVGADFSDTADFVLEATALRVPHGRTRTFSNGVYLRYQPAPTAIADPTPAPVLQPDYARQAIVYDACATWCLTIGQKNPAPFEKLFNEFLWGNPAAGDVGIIGALKKAALGQQSDPDAHRNGRYLWWRGSLR